MNNKEFIAELARRTGYTCDDTQKLVNTVVNAMSDELQDGNTWGISGFGSFDVKRDWSALSSTLPQASACLSLRN